MIPNTGAGWGGHTGSTPDPPREPRVKSKRMDTLRSEGNFACSDFSRVLSRQSTCQEEPQKNRRVEIRKAITYEKLISPPASAPL